MPDKTVIEESIRGNLQSFRKLVEESAPLAFSVAFRMTGNADDASDIVQESMLAVWKGIHKLNHPETFRSWMYRIVMNKCYDQLRKKKKSPETRADENTWNLIAERMSEQSSSRLENEEQSRILNLLTEKLSPKQKAVFVLSELEDLSNEEISEITSMSRVNVKANLHLARKRISELLGDYDV
jgi:RNA polymerase sigma-70 factor, ECF subfamily